MFYFCLVGTYADVEGNTNVFMFGSVRVNSLMVQENQPYGALGFALTHPTDPV
jgi:hypothetical protein